MKTSEKIDLISKALCEAQKEVGAAIKGSKNPYFKSNYADLAAVIDSVKEPLNSHGISFLQSWITLFLSSHCSLIRACTSSEIFIDLLIVELYTQSFKMFKQKMAQAEK